MRERRRLAERPEAEARPVTPARPRASGFRRPGWRKPRLSFLQAVFGVYLVAALAVFAFVTPPFLKNDEPAHFHRAVSLTNLDLVCRQDEQGEYYFAMERRYSDLPDLLGIYDVAFDQNARFNRDLLNIDFSQPRFDEEGRVYRFCSLPPAGYLPNALGVLAGKPFENPLVSFYGGRVAGALFFLVCIGLALRLTPARYRPLVYAFAALPTVLNQVAALSYDAAQLSLFPLLFAYFTRLLDGPGRVRAADLAVFACVLLWLVNVRLLAYSPLLLLFFVIPWRRVSPNPRDYVLKAALPVLCVAVLTVGIGYAVYGPRALDSAPEGEGIDSDRQVQFVLHHPDRFAEAVYNTVHRHGSGLLREGIGVFGWVDTTMNRGVYDVVIFVAGGLVVYQASRERPLLGGVQALLLLATLAATILLLFFSLYTIWSAVGADEVRGLQGRYFVGLMPFAVFLIAQAVALSGRELALKIGVVLLLTYLLWNLYRAVELRFY